VKRVHTGTGLLFTAAAVLIPCGIWYWLSTRQLAREAEQLEASARWEASTAAEQMASHLAVQLEELSDHEATRPYLHYWPEYMSRGEMGSAMELRTSPLSQGRRHKMILAHFQIDEDGRMTSPDPDLELGAIDFSDPAAGAPIENPIRRTQILASVIPNASAEPPRPDELAQVTPFRWQTGAWKGEPTLMAIRQVITVDQTYVQGFAVDSGCLPHWFYDGGFPAALQPGEPRKPVDAKIPIYGAAWHISVDPEPRLIRARARAATLRKQFHQSYLIGVLAAVLAGSCVVVLLRRSERLAEERSRFAAAAAHELRTPLAGIRLHGEMLALALGNPTRVAEYAQRITDEAERLSRLVSNVFSYSQLEQKRLRIHKSRGDLGQAVREALTLMGPIVEKAGAALIVRIDEGLPALELDKDAVHQIVRNLVDNAEKYTREYPDRRIEVSVHAIADGLELAVRDHGPGVPPQARSFIFKPFARQDESSASGLGLGLAVVRTLALAHGGQAHYADAPGGGACFVVRFPLA
jgi:signal transduction histidine kinase